MIKAYLKELSATTQRGDAREESFYPVLQKLLEAYAQEVHRKPAPVTVLPKKTEAGNPDFRVWDGKQKIIGYIEAKDPSVSDLDRVERSEQLKRYTSTFPNVVLTNFYEFRLYREGERVARVQIARPFIAKKLGAVPPLENEAEFLKLLEQFYSFSIPAITTAKALAIELAKRTRFLRDEVVSIELGEEQRNGTKDLRGFYEAFQKYLIGTITEEQFADLYSQTITYGLFASRTRARGDFNRELAYKYIPSTIGILRDVFRFISIEDPPKSLRVIVDDIAEVLQVTDVKRILHEFYQEGKGSDPIIHFYETFLAQYDPEVRERRGVYYTPESVVGYIVRSLHNILKTRFDKYDGLADNGVTLLDPAGGTLTFPAEAVRVVVNEVERYGTGMRSHIISSHILPNFYAFELMMAPYAIGHLKMSFLLEELGYTLKDDERFNLFLTNTLEMEDLQGVQIPGLSSLSEESHAAMEVKKNTPILVVLGNPPYSGISANINEWTEKLMKEDTDGAQSYYTVDGKPLGEKKLWLQDDYVKFLRFAQWKIHKAGHGVVGMITNHGYLDNPTFRGMRQSLMNTFDEIYILNLHGNSLKKETAPDGSKDENVFDIRQGVSIVLMVRLLRSVPRKPDPDEDEGPTIIRKAKIVTKVHYTDLWGERETKYGWLEKHEEQTTKWERIKPASPWYFFVPRDTEDIKEYLDWPSVKDIFRENNVGVVTARDAFAIDTDLHALKSRISQFRDLKNFDDRYFREGFGLKDTSTFKLRTFRTEFAKHKEWEKAFHQILYRPFDVRHIAYSKWIVERPLFDIMHHMLEWKEAEKGKDVSNLGLIIGRQGQVVGDEFPWNLTLMTELMTDFNTFYRGGGTLFPLYVYRYMKRKIGPKGIQLMAFEPEGEYVSKQRNIDDEIMDLCKRLHGEWPTPEQIFYYIYAILYSPTYREKYKEFLRIDFPRIPFTKDHKLFLALGALGKDLTDLHLMKSELLREPVARFHGEGDKKVDKPVWKDGRVHINATQCYEGVSEEAWNYQIGGYQVLHKYLKDRKGQKLEDPRYYGNVVTAIVRTIELQKEVDLLFQKAESTFAEDAAP